jgi:hypothetical protein
VSPKPKPAFWEAIRIHPTLSAAHKNLGQLVKTKKRSSWLSSLRSPHRSTYEKRAGTPAPPEDCEGG